MTRDRLVTALGVLAVVATTGARPPAQVEGGGEEQHRGADHQAEDPIPQTKKPLWVDAGFGWQWLDLTTLSAQRAADGETLTANVVPQAVGGPTAHVALGVRLVLITLGVDLGVSAFDQAASPGMDGSLQLYSIDAQLGLRLPYGRVEPYVQLGVGYSVFGGLGDAISGLGRGLDVDGANARLGMGLDYFFTPTWSLGVRATGELLFLARKGVPVRDLAAAQKVDTIGEAKARLLEGDGSSIGTAVGITIGPGIHF